MSSKLIAVVMAKVKVDATEVLNGHPDHYGVPNHIVSHAVRESLVQSVVILVEDALRDVLEP